MPSSASAGTQAREGRVDSASPGWLLQALGEGWNAIRARHEELLPVILVIGPSPVPAATRIELGHFAPMRWSPWRDSHLRVRSDCLTAFTTAIQEGDRAGAMQALAASSAALLREARQLSADASAIMSEDLITVDGVADSAVEIFATLLPWRRGRIQTLGMPSSDRASSCSACWNVGNPKGCQSDVGNLDGCPHRVISTGGYWMWNPNAAATVTSTASKMNIISANGIEPAADFRWALGERKRDSALPLVVLLDTDVEPLPDFRSRRVSSTLGGAAARAAGIAQSRHSRPRRRQLPLRGIAGVRRDCWIITRGEVIVGDWSRRPPLGHVGRSGVASAG
jgi:hypothetical protein